MDHGQDRLNGKIEIIVNIEGVVKPSGHACDRSRQAVNERMLSYEMCDGNNTGEACFKKLVWI